MKLVILVTFLKFDSVGGRKPRKILATFTSLPAEIWTRNPHEYKKGSFSIQGDIFI